MYICIYMYMFIYDDDLHLTHDDDMAGSNKWFQLWRIGVSV